MSKYLLKVVAGAAVAACAFAAHAQANHLVFSEMGLYPSDQNTSGGAEFIEIYNPTANPIALDNYYFADINQYSLLPVLPSNHFNFGASDNILRFPAGSVLQSGQVAVVTGAASTFLNLFFSGSKENYDLATGALLFETFETVSEVPNMTCLNSTPGSTTVFSLTNAGTGGGEFGVLFYWDGVSSRVKDVDILTWGAFPGNSTNQFSPKLTGYVPDAGSHAGMSVATSNADVLIRTSADEPVEVTSGGNGITGHDETTQAPVNWSAYSGRDTNMTPGITLLTTNAVNVPPLIINARRNIKAPTSADAVTLNATVTDADGTVASVHFYVDLGDGNGFVDKTPVTNAGSVYTVALGNLPTNTVVRYYVTATDNSGATMTEPAAGSNAPFAFAVTDTPAPADTIVINELQFDIIGTDRFEWIELYNRNSFPVALGGYRLYDNSEKYFEFPADAVIAANGFVLVTYSETPFRTDYPSIPGTVPVYTYKFSQDNGSDTLYLIPANELTYGDPVALMDYVAYSKLAPWPTVEPNVTGQSFELKDPALDNNNGANWAPHAPVVVDGTAKNSGTPGEPNSVLANVSDWSVY